MPKRLTDLQVKGEMPTGALFVGKPYVLEVLGKVLEDLRQQLA